MIYFYNCVKENKLSSALDRLKNLTNKISGYEISRKDNLKILENLYKEIHIDKKVLSFNELFNFRYMSI